VRRRRSAQPRATRPPERLLRPYVEDWGEPHEEPVDLGTCPGYRKPGEPEIEWRFRQMASHRWAEALREWRARHPVVIVDVRERRYWLLHGGQGGAPATWRDREAFLARADQ
jgi:hypothetical protein